jgi:hypothetical protein
MPTNAPPKMTANAIKDTAIGLKIHSSSFAPAHPQECPVEALRIICALMLPTMTAAPRLSMRFSGYHFATGSFAEQS